MLQTLSKNKTMLHFTTNSLCVCVATMLMANIHVLYAQNTENPNVFPADSHFLIY